MKPFYTQENVFYLPEESRWQYIIENAKQDDLALKIDTALYTIEKNNPALKGALPDNYYSRLHIDPAKLASLLDEINRINTDCLLYTSGILKADLFRNLQVAWMVQTGLSQMENGKTALMNQRPVSYTHLDVYKRQGEHCG